MNSGPIRFVVHVTDEVLDDLRWRLTNTRWPDEAPGAPWSQGTDLSYLRDLSREWSERFDWREQERRINSYPHFTAFMDGARVHFVHRRSGRPPLLLTHGWPSCFFEMLPLVDRLADNFDVVVPSLPGYAFSSRPTAVGIDSSHTAELWRSLMEHLGYDRFGAVGGDFGAAITTHLALRHPDHLTGILLTTPEMSPVLGPDSPPLSEAERAYLEHRARWDDTERGYSAIQSTRPQTLGYALADSPVGLAAWIIEKWRAWGDTGGNVNAHFGTDFLLTMLTIFWVTNSITSSMRDYYDTRWQGRPLTDLDYVTTRTAFSLFPNEFVAEGEPPREWYERLYNIQRWTVSPHGGHFASIEEPDRLAADIRSFFT